MLRQRLDEVEERIGGAALRAGRRREEITLVAITKLFPASAIQEAYALGVRHFGENYVQEFEGKARDVAELAGARFPFRRALAVEQGAARRRVVPRHRNHRLAKTGGPAQRRRKASWRSCSRSSSARRQSKGGVDPAALPALIDAVRGCPNLRLTGLMTMPPWSDDPEESRPYFRRLRALAEEHGLASLSMGMSQDFEVAIEEGATHVRVGTALFGSRKRE